MLLLLFGKGANEWSIISNELNALKPERALSDALSNYRVVPVDIANGKVMLSLAGASTRDVLSKGRSIGFFSSEWKERCCDKSTCAMRCHDLAKSNAR